MIKVIGVGDNVVDHYLDSNIIYPGGNALNFAVLAKMTGSEAAYLGSFGNDFAGRHVMAVLEKLCIDISRCRTIEGENGCAKVKIVDGNRVFLPGNRGGVMREKPLVFSKMDLEYIKNYDLIHSSCYSYIEPELHRLATTKLPISFDFSNRINQDYLNQVCPFVDFAFFSTSGRISESSVKTKLSQICDLGCSLCLTTRGEEGAILYDGNRYYHQQAEPVEVVDTMGAGDAFITTFLLYYVEHYFLSSRSINANKEKIVIEGLKKASKAAANTCQVRGTFGFGVSFSTEPRI
jgi:fructoselysine 6-kinase